MISFDLFAGRTSLHVLCLGAHADDIEIGCGGAVLHLLDGVPECTVDWFVCGAENERAREARQSATALLPEAAEGDIMVESFTDGFFPEAWGDIKRYFERHLKSRDPDLIFTPYRHDRHQDHRVISDLTWNTFRDHCILEYEIPKYDGDLGQPNVYVSLSQAQVQRKVDHLMGHFPTQQDKPWYTESTFRGLMRIRGVEAGHSTQYAEGFYGRKLQIGEAF